MPAKSKNITANLLTKSAFEEVSDLSKKIATNHVKIAKLTDEISMQKTRLSEVSRDVFFTDLGAEVDSEGNYVLTNHSDHVPEVFGNHEYDAGKHRVSVNFKVSAKEIEDVEGHKPETKLPAIFGENYEKIFVQTDEYEITSSPDQIRRNLERRPELFSITLKPDLPIEKLREMRSAFPGCFDVSVCDPEKYAIVYPDQTKKNPRVKLGAKFLEKAGKLSEDVLREAKTFIVGYLSSNLSTAVVCGPASKNKKK